MKRIIATALILSSQIANAQGMFRLWRGFKLDALTSESFINGVGQNLIPATVRVGATNPIQALSAYLPMFLVGTSTANVQLKLPDEIALIAYSSKEQYEALRATPEGKEYGEMHWLYFDKAKGSASAVAEDYVAGTDVVAEHAYRAVAVGANDYAFPENWQRDNVRIEILKTSENFDTKVYKQHLDAVLENGVSQGLREEILLPSNGYAIRYLRIVGNAEGSVFEIPGTQILTSTIAKKADFADAGFHLNDGEAGNAQFSYEPIPQTNDEPIKWEE